MKRGQFANILVKGKKKRERPERIINAKKGNWLFSSLDWRSRIPGLEEIRIIKDTLAATGDEGQLHPMWKERKKGKEAYAVTEKNFKISESELSEEGVLTTLKKANRRTFS